MDVPHFVVASWGRLLVGFALAIVAGLLMQLGRGLDWGLAAICWVPAIILLLPALHLARRTRLVAEVDGITLETGWLFQRGWTFRLSEAELEFVPTAGWWAVVLRRGGNRVTLATWLSRRRAEALGQWLDAVSGSPLPRVEGERPAGDR